MCNAVAVKSGVDMSCEAAVKYEVSVNTVSYVVALKYEMYINVMSHTVIVKNEMDINAYR